MAFPKNTGHTPHCCLCIGSATFHLLLKGISGRSASVGVWHGCFSPCHLQGMPCSFGRALTADVVTVSALPHHGLDPERIMLGSMQLALVCASDFLPFDLMQCMTSFHISLHLKLLRQGLQQNCNVPCVAILRRYPAYCSRPGTFFNKISPCCTAPQDFCHKLPLRGNSLFCLSHMQTVRAASHTLALPFMAWWLDEGTVSIKPWLGRQQWPS